MYRNAYYSVCIYKGSAINDLGADENEKKNGTSSLGEKLTAILPEK